MTEPTNHPPQLAHLLDIKPALTWIQYKLPEESTHSIIQLATLQATFGSLGDIAEIFLFEPRSEGFIIFYGSLQIPNFDGILSPHHGLIMIKNPRYPSPPIRSTAAPHYPTRRPAIGTLVTLSAQGRGRHEAMVVAIEWNHWPTIQQADEGARLDYFNAHDTTCTTLGPAQGAQHICLPEQVIRDSDSPPRRAQALRPDPPADSGRDATK